MERATFLMDASGERIPCLLNPNTLTFRRSSGLQVRASLGGAVSGTGLADVPLFHDGGGLTELTLDLLFDTSLIPPIPHAPEVDDDAQRDVRTLTRPLWQLAENPLKHGPLTRVRLVWGKAWNFPGYVAALAERLEDFLPSGVPRRSFLRMRMWRSEERAAVSGVELEPVPEPAELGAELDAAPLLEIETEPEPSASAGYEYHVSLGQPLFLMAYDLLGDAGAWRQIADANPELDPLSIPPGTLVRVPIAAERATAAGSAP